VHCKGHKKKYETQKDTHDSDSDTHTDEHNRKISKDNKNARESVNETHWQLARQDNP